MNRYLKFFSIIGRDISPVAQEIIFALLCLFVPYLVGRGLGAMLGFSESIFSMEYPSNPTVGISIVFWIVGSLSIGIYLLVPLSISYAASAWKEANK